MKNLILFTSLFFSSFALSQKASFSDAETYVLTSIGIYKPYPEYIFFAKESKPDLFQAKDEFETTAEYRSRLEGLKKHINKSKLEYKDEMMRRKIALENANKVKIDQSLTSFSTKISKIGSYDADNELFDYINIQDPLGYDYNGLHVTEAKVKQATPVFSKPRTRAEQLLLLPKNSIVRIVSNREIGEYVYIAGWINSEELILHVDDYKDIEMEEYSNFDAMMIDQLEEGLARLTEGSKKYKKTQKLIQLKKESYLNKLEGMKKQYMFKANIIQGFVNRSFLNINSRHKYKIKIPRNQARSFKESYYNDAGNYGITVEGTMQLNNNMNSYNFFNMVAIDPKTGSRFPFGPQNDDANLFVDKKKAIIPPFLNMKVAFMEPNGNSYLDAGEAGKVKVSISNSGKGSAVGVTVNLNSINKNDQIVIQSPKQILGEIAPGDTEITEFEIVALKSVKKAVNEFTITVDEAYGYPPDPFKLDFETYPFLPPRLVLADHGVETPNERNEIRPLTAAIVESRIQNQGTGPANNVVFDIGLPNGIYFTPDSKQKYTFDTIEPGQFKDLNFSFNVSRNVGKEIKVMISYMDENKKGSFPLVLDVAKPQQSIQQLSIKGSDMKIPTFTNVASISVDVEKNIPKLKRNGKNDLAVIFGIENYKNVSNVSFAKRDAEWMKVYFENMLGIPTKRIYFKTDSDVGQAEFSKVFSEGGWLDKRLKKEKTNIFIYYAGHGAPDIKKNSGYLIPYDGDVNYPSQTGYKIDRLYTQLGKLKAKTATVFLDACFSGANRNSQMLLADARPVLLKVKSNIPPNVSVFSAASGMEFSSSWPQKKHGLFTYFLMKGLKKEADTNQDKKITYGELGDYINLNVSETAGMLDREQTPQLKTIDKDKILISF